MPLALFYDLLDIYPLSLLYLLIFANLDRASRLRNLQRLSRREVTNDADKVDEGSSRLL